MEIGRGAYETRARCALRDLRVFRVREGREILRAGFDRGGFGVGLRVGVMGFDQADVIEEELVAPGRAELAAFEEDANLRGGAVFVVGLHFDDDRHFVRGVAFENDLLELEFFTADAGAFLDRALDHVAGHALLARFLHDGGEARVADGIGPAHFRGDHDFFDQFTGRLTFFEAGDLAFGVEPLTSHAALVAGQLRRGKSAAHGGWWKMDLDLKEKKAFVSGSTAGIGRAIASRLAREGAEVWVNGREEERVEEALAEIRKDYAAAKVHGIAADLGTAEGCDDVVRQLPQLDLLVNNVGIFEPKPFAQISDADWEKFFTVNVLSGVRLSRAYLAGMKERNWGRIVFISSESGLQIPVEMIHYGTTKTAQLALARGLAESCSGTNVTVNSVLPGPTASEGVSQFVKQLAEEKQMSHEEFERDFFKNARPSSLLQRFLEPEEIANVVAFVCSPLASAMNGASVRADGGVIRSIA